MKGKWTIEKLLSKQKTGSLKKINKIDKALARLIIKKKRERENNVIHMSNEKGVINTADTKEQ